MKDFWTALGVITAIAAISLSLFVFFHGETSKRKDLEVTLISRMSLVNKEFERKKGKIKVYYEGEIIENYSLLQLKIENTGRQPIKKADFSQPLKILLQGANEIVTVEKVRSDPEDLKIVTDISQSLVKVENILLNPTDWYILEVGVVSGSNSLPDVKGVSARITEIKKVKFHSDLKASPKVQGKSIIPIAASLFSIVTVIIYSWERFSMKRLYKYILQKKAIRLNKNEQLIHEKAIRLKKNEQLIHELSSTGKEQLNEIKDDHSSK